ncbi:hypothetical protein E4582_07200 [Luteimonas yindakuii]|uniref:Uncharacterized protein n=1 Tax=Luteimonas yindakuii TaxID=2565782 RepID=A0A4Z1R510_9GAMM|nr:hypothetical protein [Luteimonas yindakuii]QCO68182.1 hypothetical protein E5843_11205 [Luteimonas yindakuii]TKS54560.1 hypothetical protein E4582_07200 [Luteimonas yindakuii]
MYKAIATLLLATAPVLSFASDCAISLPASATPLPATVLTAVSPELVAPAYRPGAHGGVLAPGIDASQSLEQVLLRIQLEGCPNLSASTTAVDPNDPSVYQPKTEFDNTPWRFDMQQEGKMMTADAFDAWMKARGVRVARGVQPAAVPAADPVPAEGESPAPVPTSTN